MAKLYLLRHLKSQWNKEKRFAGWGDNPLSDEGRAQAKEIAEKLVHEKIDKVYTSELVRNTETVLRIFETTSNQYPLFMHLDGGKRQTWGNFSDAVLQNVVLVGVSEKLNERYYGNLQGMLHEDMIKKYGEDQIHIWRRSYNVKPPGGESMKDTYKRAIPFFKKYVQKDLAAGKNVLVVASHNSLRAIVKHIENISDEDITNVELPFGALVQYEYSEGKFTKK
ncbi:MAG: hypothetical protein A3D44_02435 [Candidatus Staskawiczbacteria bacterium RIFCSPHIGHO2_02_FULL_42_22]|uniref:phosphoglycerate mutase (2,3-diphosphoglycerate-dependent) n=1 Tax=Candidatus Staskawiczbacteria bacterium RIFCSPHIGHO2_02_FULL_42_22 TaxID=1802207 RepID=A0A1G2HZ91_9BACT|nr:MAG: hypothetical protein A3D44_02435 [Candidatus Staskawiczbacteria bacterium RIFCSPHIGHO2_02_FULL_42_22]